MGRPVDNPQRSELSVNTNEPNINTLELPKNSEILPNIRRKLVIDIRYAVIVHWEFARVVWKNRVIVGSAIETTLPSTTAIKMLTRTRA